MYSQTGCEFVWKILQTVFDNIFESIKVNQLHLPYWKLLIRWRVLTNIFD